MKYVNIKAFNVKPMNVTGAGDVWNAGFIYSLLNDFNIEDAGKFANATAALFISNAYKKFPKIHEIKNFLNTYSEP